MNKSESRAIIAITVICTTVADELVGLVTIVESTRHLPTYVMFVVKLLGEDPTLYYWNVTTPDVVLVPQVFPMVWLTPQAVNDLLWQHPVEHPLFVEQEVPALAVTAVWFKQTQVWLRLLNNTTLLLMEVGRQTCVTLVVVVPFILLY